MVTPKKTRNVSNKVRAAASKRMKVLLKRQKDEKIRAEQSTKRFVEITKMERIELEVRDDGLVYRKGKPVKCLRNTRIMELRAAGEDEKKIRDFIAYLDVKGEE